MRISRLAMIGITIGMASMASGSVSAQTGPLRTQDLGNGIYAIFGPGGNIGVWVGEDGVILIDDMLAQASTFLINAVAEITDKPIRFLINTHWHGDHTGGNQPMSKVVAAIVAHENVRERMSVDQVQTFFNRTRPASPPEALPVITFTKQVTFHLNGDTARVFHVPNAHTDGDAVIYFEKANTIHMGDLYFAGMYPFVDIDSDGGTTGLLAGLDKILTMINDQTTVISGHGAVTKKAELQAYRDVILELHNRILKMVKDGKSLEEVLEAKVTADYDEVWGPGFQGYNDPVSFVTYAYHGLVRDTM